MQNLFELSEDIKGMPDDYLVKHVQQTDGTIPSFMALSELQRRQDMRQRFAANPPTTTVADDILAKQPANPTNPTLPLPSAGASGGGGSGLPSGNGLQPNSGGIAAGAPQGYATGGSIWGDEDWKYYTPRIQSFEGQNSYTSQNPHSSARGAYQFTRGTYKQYAKKAGVNPDDWSPEAQDKVFKAFTEDNLDTLQKNDISPTATNAYTTHFLGGTGGVSFLKALERDPDAPVSDHFDKHIREINPAIFKNAKTLGDVYGKMQEVGGNSPGVKQAPERSGAYLANALTGASASPSGGSILDILFPAAQAQEATGIKPATNAQQNAKVAGPAPDPMDAQKANVTPAGRAQPPDPKATHDFTNYTDYFAGTPGYGIGIGSDTIRDVLGGNVQAWDKFFTKPLSESGGVAGLVTNIGRTFTDQMGREIPVPGGLNLGSAFGSGGGGSGGGGSGMPESAPARAGSVSEDRNARAKRSNVDRILQDKHSTAYRGPAELPPEVKLHAASTPESEELTSLTKQLADLYKSQITSKEDMRSMALLQAGLGIAAGESPYFATNVGRGAQAGIESWNAAQKGNSEATSNYAQLLQRQAEVSAAGRRADRGLDIQQEQLNISRLRADAYAAAAASKGYSGVKIKEITDIFKEMIAPKVASGIPLTDEEWNQAWLKAEAMARGTASRGVGSSSNDDGSIMQNHQVSD